MKKLILFIVSFFVITLFSCGADESYKTITHYKSNITWGMSISEVREQLGTRVREYTGTYILAEDDEGEIICAYDPKKGGADVRYNFTNDGELCEIEIEVNNSEIDYSAYCDIVELYQMYYDELEVDELEIYNEKNGSERAGTFCNLDENTQFSVIYVRTEFYDDPYGSITVTYKNPKLLGGENV